MAYYVTGGLDQLPDWSKQHASSAPLQGLNFFNRLRADQEVLEDAGTRSVLKAAAVDANGEHLACEAEIEALKSRLSVLQQASPILKLRSDAFDSLMLESKAPIRRVPNDVLVAIFEMACADPLRIYLGDPPNWHPRTPEHAMLIASVCSKWRTLALDSSVLWTNIRMNCMVVFQWRSSKAQLLYLEEIFRRSKNRPLQIIIDDMKDLGVVLENPRSRITPVFWNPLFDSLARHLAARCQTLTVLGDYIFRHLEHPKHIWTTLKSLCLESPVPVGRWPRFSSQWFPALRRVELDGLTRRNWRSNISMLDWQLITTFDAQQSDMLGLCKILPRCINLQVLKLSDIKESSFPVKIKPERISLPSLRHLYICRSPSGDEDRDQEDLDILRSLHIPSLQSLHLATSDITLVHSPVFRGRKELLPFRAPAFLRGLTDKLTRLPSHSLRSLAMSMRASDFPELQDLLKKCPGLKIFSLGLTMPFGEATLGFEPLLFQMTARIDQAESYRVLLPSLKEFTLDLSSVSPNLYSQRLFRSLVDLARSRLKPPSNVSRLQNLRVTCQRWEGSKELDELKELKGIEIVLKMP